MGEENKTRDAIDAVTGLVKAVPIYKDAIQPTAKEIGVGIQRVVHLALAPIGGMVWGYEKIEEFLKTSVAKRLEKVPHEQIKTPLPQIAGPAIEALKYAGHDENLREMFAKLIATAMDEKTAATAHPSFVEIIRQLSSDEAKICRYLKTKEYVCVINLEEHAKDRHRVVVRNFSNLGHDAYCQFPLMILSYSNNLTRLGIIQFIFDGELADKEPYEELKKHSVIQNALKEIQDAKHESRFERGYVITTAFGRQFAAACID